MGKDYFILIKQSSLMCIQIKRKTNMLLILLTNYR